MDSPVISSVGTLPIENTPAALISSMSPDQKKMLSAFGVDVGTVTPEMIACAETSLSATRIAEIKNGASISASEKMKFIACYKF